MNVRNCKKCGKIFNYVAGLPICPSCRELSEEEFQKVKKYIQENKNKTIGEVAEACEVDQAQIRQWIRDERLEFSSDSMVGIGCEKCGATIRSGRFCEKCKAETANGFREAAGLNKKPVQQKPGKDPKDSPKMRFLQ